MLKQICKGMVIGIANVIPGVSGGTMAVSMGIYDKLISALTHIFSEFKESIKVLIPILLGAGIGGIGLSFMIEFLLGAFPLQTNFMFIGLIVGGLPAILSKVKGTKLQVKNLLSAVIFFALVVGFAALGEKDGNSAALSVDFVSMIKLFGIGIIASATMVIPGVSGSMILMLLGYYEPIIENINAFIRALAAFDIPALLYGCGILIPFGIGVVFGIFAIAKVIEIIFKKFPMLAYYAIIGLIIASPIAIILCAGIEAVTLVSVITGVITFALGGFIAYKLGGE